jgi:hypothetical protein
MPNMHHSSNNAPRARLRTGRPDRVAPDGGTYAKITVKHKINGMRLLMIRKGNGMISMTLNRDEFQSVMDALANCPKGGSLTVTL